MKKIAISLFAFFMLSAYAADNWFELTRSEDDTRVYYSTKDSIKLAVNASNLPIVISKMRVVMVDKNDMVDGLWYVTIDDCKAGKGDLSLLEPSGQFVKDIPFDIKEKDISSFVATAMCSWAQGALNGKQNPSNSRVPPKKSPQSSTIEPGDSI